MTTRPWTAVADVRTRLSPPSQTNQERLERSREHLRQQQSQRSSTAMLPVVVATLVGLLVAVILLRRRGGNQVEGAVELEGVDVLVDAEVRLTEMGASARSHTDDDLVLEAEGR